MLALAGLPAGAFVHHRGRHQGEQRGAQHHRSDGNVPVRHEGEDRQRRAGGDRHLWDVLAEEGLKLLDAVDDGQHHAAGAFGAEPGGAECHDLVVEPSAQRLLHPCRGAMRDHDAHVVEPGAQQDGGERGDQRDDQFAGGCRAEQAGEELAEEGEARDADGEREQAEGDAQRDPPPQTASHPPQSQIEMHGGHCEAGAASCPRAAARLNRGREACDT